MSRFTFTEEEEAFRKEMRTFCEKELLPGATKRMKDDFVHGDLWKKMGDAGILGIGIPSEYGGTPASLIKVGILHEELGRIDLGMCFLENFALTLYHVLDQGASEELKEELLPPVLRGEKLICMGITEPDSGSDVAATSTTATKDGSNYIINGVKTSIDYTMQGDGCWLLATVNPGSRGKGITLFYVPFDLDGVSRLPYTDMGCKAQKRATIKFNNVSIPSVYRISEEGAGFDFFKSHWNMLRPLTGLPALGAAQVSLEAAIDFAKRRKLFGTTIADFQAVSFRIADHATKIEAAKLLCYHCLALEAEGVPVEKAAMAKWYSCKVALDAIYAALITHGHRGYKTDLPFEQRLADVIGFQIFDGTEDIMKLIISKTLMG